MEQGSGVDGLHCTSGVCDLCGDPCDANTQELNVLSCTFKNCEDLPYHQDCLEKYLKSIRLERNRKTGFKCPRGCGKGTTHREPCPGKIDKSHPIHPRNEEQKKKKKAKLPEVMLQPPPRPIKTKEEKKAEKAAAAKAAAAAAEKAGADKGKQAKATAKPAGGAAKAGAAAAKPPPPPDPRAKLAEALAAARRELAAGKAAAKEQQQPPQPVATPAPEYKTLDAYYRDTAASSSSLSSMSSAAAAPAPPAAAPVANAWAKPPVPAPVAAADRGRGQHKADAGRQQQQPSATSSRAESPSGSTAPLGHAGGGGLVTEQHSLHSHQLLGSSSSLLSQQSCVSGIGGSGSFHAAANAAAAHAAAAAGGANGLHAPLPVGAAYLAGEEPPAPLTKAQKKNLKRAEKKKKSGLAETGSAEGDGPGSDYGAAASSSSVTAAAGPGGSGRLSRQGSAGSAHAGSGGGRASGAAAAAAGQQDDSGLMYELALQALLANKTLALVASLQRLGFAEWAAAAAVQRHGSELEDAVAWLLEGGAADPAAAAASMASGCVADVSIAEELALMEALTGAMPGLSRSEVYHAVADAGGDLDAAAGACLQQQAAAAAAGEAESSMGSPVADTTQQQQQQQVAEPISPAEALMANGLQHQGGGYGGGGQNLYDPNQTFAAWLPSGNAGSSSAAVAAAEAAAHADQQLQLLQQQQLQQQQAAAAAAGSFSFMPADASSLAPPSSVGAIWGNAASTGGSGLSSAAGVSAGGAGSWALDSSGVPSTAGLFGSSGLGLGLGSYGYGSGGASSSFATPGLGLLAGLQQQQSLSASDPVLESFGSGLAGSSSALQESRLFSSYGWRQQPLFPDAQQQQPQQQAQQQQGAPAGGAGDADETDLEGLMATLMCH